MLLIFIIYFCVYVIFSFIFIWVYASCFLYWLVKFFIYLWSPFTIYQTLKVRPVIILTNRYVLLVVYECFWRPYYISFFSIYGMVNFFANSDKIRDTLKKKKINYIYFSCKLFFNVAFRWFLGLAPYIICASNHFAWRYGRNTYSSNELYNTVLTMLYIKIAHIKRLIIFKRNGTIFNFNIKLMKKRKYRYFYLNKKRFYYSRVNVHKCLYYKKLGINIFNSYYHYKGFIRVGSIKLRKFNFTHFRCRKRKYRRLYIYKKRVYFIKPKAVRFKRYFFAFGSIFVLHMNSIAYFR